jgi:GDSL-like Lipase/Acylhydrolase family
MILDADVSRPRWPALLVSGLVSSGLMLMACSERSPSPRPTATPTTTPSPLPSLTTASLAALGDSYMAGEGAPASYYEKGTNSVGRNECRRASYAYPRLIAAARHEEVLALACSGARTEHILADGQHKTSPATVYGGRPQVEVLGANNGTKSVLVQVGGNDAGFAKIAGTCVNPLASCVSRGNVGRWMTNLDEQVLGKLERVYVRVRPHRRRRSTRSATPSHSRRAIADRPS